MKRKQVILAVLFIGSLIFMQFGCSGGSAEGNKEMKTEAALPDSTQADSTASDSSKMKGDNKQAKIEEELIPVEVTTVKQGEIASYLLLSSNLETEKMADVFSRVQGLVEKLYVEEGDYVKKSQTLMQLEADEYSLAEEKARINYEQQKSAFERISSMYNKELLSKDEYEQAKFALDAVRIEWEQAKLNLDYTKISTPINGVVVDRLRKIGDRIQTTDKLFTVINTDEMIVIVYVPEKEIMTIKKGQTAYVVSNNIENQRFPGWVKRVSPAVDPQSGTFKVTVGVNNKENKLRPGMFVNVHIVTAIHEDAVLIPKTAIVYENEAMNVFVVRDSVAHKVMLNVGFQDYEKVESLDGIEAGDKVIVVGQAGLKDKTRVNPVMERNL